jgi:hypothetical protein
MGLNIHVRCTCMRDGRAAPHPIPELLRFDENGDPYLDWEHGATESQWTLHQQWAKNGCPHEDGYLVFKHLGNISSIAHVREHLKRLAHSHFPLLIEKVVYSGTHGGDSIQAGEAELLLREARFLIEGTSDLDVKTFASDMIELTEASVATGNPIVF